MCALAGLVVCSLGVASAAAAPMEQTLFSVPDLDLGVVATATDPTGTHVLMALKQGDEVALYFDGRKLDQVPALEQMEVRSDGSWAYAWADSDARYLSTPQGTAGPFDGLAMPSVERLVALRTPDADEWAYRGGSRVVMGSRAGDGQWVALLRFLASPGSQDVRPLGTLRQVVPGTDPWTYAGAPRRFAWVGTKVVSVAQVGNRECFLDGLDKGLCGQKVALFVPAPKGERFVYAVQQEGGLRTVTPWGEVEVKGRLDWVSFDDSGEHLLMAFEDKERWVVWVDGKEQARHDLLSTAFWKLNGSWLAAVGDGARWWLVDGQGGKQILTGLQGVGLSPKGDVVPLGMGPLGPYVGDVALAGQAKDAWGLAFTPKGTPYCLVNRGDAKGQSIWFGGKLSSPYPRVRVVGASPSGGSLLSLGEMDRQAAVLTGAGETEVVQLHGELDRVVWCQEKAYLLVDTATNTCVAGSGKMPCCAHVLGVACDGQQVRLLCKEEDGVHWVDESGRPSTSLGEVLPHLIVRDRFGSVAQFAARLGSEWSLRSLDVVKPLDGPVRQALAGPEAPWFQVNVGRLNQWEHGGLPAPAALRVKPPFDVSGVGVYWALLEEGEAWVVGNTALPVVERILGGLTLFENGFLYWARVKGGVELRRVTGVIPDEPGK